MKVSPVLKVAVYARVSTTDQNCEMQLRELREYISRRGWSIHNEYVDTGWSGSKSSRPQLNRLKQDARERRFDTVLVWKLDRWGRSVADSIQGIQELASLGIRWIAVTQNLDTDESNPMSRFLLHIMAAFAELEREMIRERVKAGMQLAKHRGKALGRRRCTFDRRKALEMRKAGASIRAVAAEFRVSIGTIHALFKATS